MRSPLASPVRGGFRDLTPLRGRGRSTETRAPGLSALSAGRFVVAHRGGAGVRPENLYSSYSALPVLGFTVIDTDVWLTSDNGLAVMHDSTVDRTTTSTGNVSALTKSAFQALTSDPGSYLSAGGYSSETPLPTLDGLFAQYGNRAIHFPEAKATGSGALIVAAAQAAGIDDEHILVQSFGSAELTDAVSAGYPACLLVTDLTTITPATVKGDGIDYVGASTGLDSVTVAACHSAGLKVGAWTYNRRSEWTTLQTAGVDFVWSDHPEWTAGLSTPATSDPYSALRWWPGSVANVTTLRGQFTSPNIWGFNSSSGPYFGLPQTWACPVAAAASSYSISFDLSIDAVLSGDTSRWASIYLCAGDDRAFDDFNPGVTGVYGYHLLIRANGTLNGFRVNDGAATSSLGSTSIAAPTLGAWYRYTVSVSPTAVTLRRDDVPGTVLAMTDSTYRGGYFWLGRNAAQARYRSVTIS